MISPCLHIIIQEHFFIITWSQMEKRIEWYIPTLFIRINVMNHILTETSSSNWSCDPRASFPIFVLISIAIAGITPLHAAKRSKSVFQIILHAAKRSKSVFQIILHAAKRSKSVFQIILHAAERSKSVFQIILHAAKRSKSVFQIILHAAKRSKSVFQIILHAAERSKSVFQIIL